jgi:very-short-patch-repair endonuclease
MTEANVADFACVSERLIVEVDGATHWALEEIAHDANRAAFLESSGWRVVRVTNLDVFENVSGLWRTTECALRPPPTASPSPPPRAGEETGVV